jgi:hypothetical protein
VCVCVCKKVSLKVICTCLTFVHYWLSRQTAAGQAPISNPEHNVQNRCISHLNSHRWQLLSPRFLPFDLLQHSITTRLTCRVLCVQFVIWSFVQEKKRQQNLHLLYEIVCMMVGNFSFQSLAAWCVKVVPSLRIHYVCHFHEAKMCKSHPQRNENYTSVSVQGTLWKIVCMKRW